MSNFKAKQVEKIGNAPSSSHKMNSTPNESCIVPEFQPVFVAWASTFEEHNSLRTGLKHFPNFS
jgi:hypothetical protein